MIQLKIARDFAVPLDAVTQTFAQIGRKGAGKTHLAGLMAELMLDAEAQVIAIDPVGNWWGLRVGADGRSKGKDIFVIGGERGDVPITPESGARIAQLLVEKRISSVLDVSSFREGERKRFSADFAEEFFHRKKTQRSPVHIFVEESQKFIPQRPGPDEARMLGAWENIIRLGRNYGIGASLITQRPQSVNKEVLSQVECLCVLQVTGLHERKAIEEWVQEAGADRKLVGYLPSLARGEGYVWSPAWLRRFERVHFARKTTFDASATPEVGQETRAAKLSQVDVEALRTDLSEIVKKAEADDPRALRRRIAELERSVQKPNLTPNVKSLSRTIELPILKDTQIKRLESVTKTIGQCIGKLQNVSGPILVALMGRSSRQTVPAPFSHGYSVKMGTPEAPAKALGIIQETDEPGLGRCERAILISLAQYPQGRNKNQVAILTGYSTTSGGFNNSLGSLRSKGYIAGGSGHMTATPEGLSALGPYNPLPTGKELLNHWIRELPRCEAAILAELSSRPNPMTKESLGEATGYSPISGGFNNALGRLRTLELITRGSEIALSDNLLQ